MKHKVHQQHYCIKYRALALRVGHHRKHKGCFEESGGRRIFSIHSGCHLNASILHFENTSTQIYKYTKTNIHIHKNTNTQVDKYMNTHLDEYHQFFLILHFVDLWNMFKCFLVFRKTLLLVLSKFCYTRCYFQYCINDYITIMMPHSAYHVHNS